jgi:citrate lyase subunit beta/citryl-CoA lyase
VWRSLLYVPVNVEKYVEKAHTRGADGIVLDLEDSVPASAKEAARKLVGAAARRARRGGGDVIVRINSPRELAEPDLAASIGEDVDGIAITKAQSAEHVRRIDDFISSLEAKRGLRAGHTRLIALIETSAALFQMPAIAQASPRLAALTLGGEDLATETGLEPAEETLTMPSQQLIFAAYSAGLMPMGFMGSIAGFADPEAFRAMVRRSRRFGFMGASCIHPGQVAILNEEFSPPPDKVDWARRVVEGNAQHEAAGRASWSLDGKMIDVPIVARARKLLERHAAIEAREARKKAG